MKKLLFKTHVKAACFWMKMSCKAFNKGIRYFGEGKRTKGKIMMWLNHTLQKPFDRHIGIAESMKGS